MVFCPNDTGAPTGWGEAAGDDNGVTVLVPSGDLSQSNQNQPLTKKTNKYCCK